VADGATEAGGVAGRGGAKAASGAASTRFCTGAGGAMTEAGAGVAAVVTNVVACPYSAIA